jgi:hypothetical protein
MDPNGIVGPPIPDRWVWLAPDWSTSVPGAAGGSRPKEAPPGATLVKVRDTLFNNGRKVTVVLDANGRPLAADGTPTTAAQARVLEESLDDEQVKVWKTAQGTVRPTQTTVEPNPATGKPSQKKVYPDGHVEWDDTGVPAATAKAGDVDWHTEGTPDGQGGFDNTRPIMVATIGGVRQTRQLDDKELRAWQNAQQMQRNPGGKTDAEIVAEADKARKEAEAAAEKNKPQPGKPYQNEQGQWVTPVVGPDGTVTTKPLPPEAVPQTPSEEISAPASQKWIEERRGDTVTTRLNPNWKPESKVVKDEATGTWVQITETAEGGYTIKPVNDQTVIKPADLPVLQAKYGEIAQGLGALAQDLNSRYARGEITEKQKNDAFTAAHQQAQTQVSEINQILDTSKAIWSGELTQRGQSLGETQSRRGFAQSIFDRAAATGMGIATSAGPGHGKDIAAGVGALMNIGQRYAEGMGGFRESPEVPLPAALQQARGIGIPGYEGAGSPGSPGITPGISPGISPGSPSGGGAAPPAAPPAPGTPGLPAPIFRPPPPIDGAMTPQSMLPGQDPRLAAMQQQLMGGDGFGGSPVAAGGLGVYDPTQDVQGMVGDGADPTWAEAVRRAAGEVTQPGYAWQRFQQPTSRFG